jgi:rhomboid protease GluP
VISHLPSFEAIHIRDTLIRESVMESFRTGLRRWPPLTTGLVVFMVVLHLGVGGVDVWAGAPASSILLGDRSPQALVLFGARADWLIRAGEPWRLLSCVFLHAGFFHLGLNMLALFGLGRLCETVYGSQRLLALFLVSGLLGSVLSYIGGTELSVGASGAVFGLMGAGVVFGLRNRSRLPAPLRSVFGRGLMPWVVLNLLIGLSVPRIDNLGHIGGMLGGAACAGIFGDRLIPGQEGMPRLLRASTGIGIGLLVWTGVQMARAVGHVFLG